MNSLISKAILIALSGLLVGPAAQAQMVTPTQWLASQPKPFYKAGHTLPRLTRYGYQVPFEVTKELTENWGYALQLHEGYLNAEVVARLDDPNSYEARIAALTTSDSVKYPLFVTTSRRMPELGEVLGNAWTRNASGQLLSGQLSSPDGTLWSAGEELIYSTEAPDSVWALAGEYRAAPLRALVARVPVNIVLNGGEYGMGHVGLGTDGAGYLWGLDPAHNAAVNNTPWSGGRNGHSSAKKANSELIIANAVRAAAPQRSLYVYYTAGGRTLRNQFYGSDFYGGFWEHSRGISDIPSNEIYYQHIGNSGFIGDNDILTIALNATALEITAGNPLSYSWLTGGWQRGSGATDFADINRWTGFLKCYFTAGLLGGNVGAYGDDNTSLAASFPNASPTYHYKDLIALSHVQALFSQVEGTLRNSDLLPGPAQHQMSGDVPAYEFPTGEGVLSRVLARKHRTEATWLVTAWAAAGANRDVTVYIPEVGQLTVEARVVGSVYKVTVSGGNKTVVRIDNEGATYTAVADGVPVVSALNLAVPTPFATGRLAWFSADSGVTADGANKVSSWAGLSGGLTVTQTDASKRPTLVANAIGGKPALRFVNGQSWLKVDPSAAQGDAYIGGLNIFTVFTGAASANRRVVSGADTGGTDYIGGFNVADGITSADELRNGVLVRTSGAQCNTRMISLAIGDAVGPAGPGYGFGLSGDIAEVLIYKAMSEGQQALVRNYLLDKYSVSTTTGLAGGSFESPVVTGYRYTPNQGAGWFFTNYSAIQANGSAFGAANAPNGSQTAVLQGFGANPLPTMSQTVNLDAGTYSVSFKAARRAGSVQPIKVMLDSTQIGGLITAANDAFTDYTTVPFTVTTGKHILRFEAVGGSSDRAVFIDQVVLNPLSASAPPIAGATVFSDSFESPAVSGLPNGFLSRPSGTAWNFLSSAAIQANGSAWGAVAAPNGVQTAVLQGAPNGLGSITRTLSLGQGFHSLSFKAARRSGQAQPIRFSVDGVQIGNLITPASNSFTSYTLPDFTVTAGSHILKLEATDNTGDKTAFIDQVTLVSNEVVPPNALLLKIQAENFTAMNGIITQPTTDVDGVSEIATIDVGDWLDYTVNVPIAGRYVVDFRLACASSNRQLQLRKGPAILAEINVPATGSNQTWQTVSVGNLPLAAGTQTLRIYAKSGGWQFNWFQLTFAAIQIEAESYVGNLGVSATVSGVSAGVTTVTGTAAGGWLDFTVNVPNSGIYDIEFGSPNPGVNAAFNLQNSSGGSITLAAGSQTLRVNTTASDWNLDWLRLIPRAAATLPAGASYPFAIQQFIRATNGSHTLRFTGDPDRTYRVTRSADMLAPFANLATPLTVKTNLEGSGEISVPATAGPQNFYRIER